MVRVICVGNRLVHEDSLGPRVYDELASRELPPGVSVIEGGIAGLRLLGAVEGAERVIFVDALSGAPSGVVTVEGGDARLPEAHDGHGAGLGYLLGALPHVCEGAPPAWSLVGAAGAPDDELVAAVAARALALATAPRPGGGP